MHTIIIKLLITFTLTQIANILQSQFFATVATPAANRGMELTAAGRAHIAKRRSNVSLTPNDVVNKEIADKRRRDKACK